MFAISSLRLMGCDGELILMDDNDDKEAITKVMNHITSNNPSSDISIEIQQLVNGKFYQRVSENIGLHQRDVNYLYRNTILAISPLAIQLEDFHFSTTTIADIKLCILHLTCATIVVVLVHYNKWMTSIKRRTVRCGTRDLEYNSVVSE